MPTKFAVIAVWAEDVSTTAHFYRDVLGLEMLPQHMAQPHFKIDGIYFLILKGQPIPATDAEPDRFPLFALSVDYLDDAIARLNEYQVPLPWGIEQNPSERWVMFKDPGGNLIELVEWKAKA